MYIVDDKHKIILLFFAKSGCSTVRLAYVNMIFDDMSEPEKHEYLARHGSVFKSHHAVARSGALYLHQSKFADYTVVCVFRNTFKRLASTFVDKILDFKTDIPEKAIPHHSQDAKRSFPAFIEYIQNHNTVDPHFQHQSLPHYIIPYIDETIEIGDLKREIFKHRPAVRAKFIAHLEDRPVVNRTETRTDVSQNLARYNFEEDKDGIRAQRQAPPYRLFYDAELIERVKTLYREEIDRFGVSFEDLL